MFPADLPPICFPPRPAIIRPVDARLLTPGYLPASRQERRAALADLLRRGVLTKEQVANAFVVKFPPTLAMLMVNQLIGFGVGGGIGGNDAFTKLLLHCDGADASTAFTDSSAGAKTVTANGNAQIDTAQSKFGGASALFDGTGDYLSTPDSADWAFGSGNFTIDFWIRLPSIPTDIAIFQQYVSDSNRMELNVDTGSLTFYALSAGSYVAHYTATPGLSANTWYHLAVVRNGSSLAIYKDGIAYSLTTLTAIGTLPDLSATLDFGKGHFNAADKYLNGWIDEVRVSKDIARWTTDFTPPSQAYDAG
jgi:hypothetical protein